MDNIYMKYYRLSHRLMLLLYLNILWVLFSLLGLVFFGVVPATLAMFSVVREWVIKENEMKVLPKFWETYKNNFIKGNIFAIIIFVVGQLLLVFLQILQTNTSFFYLLASGIVLGMMVAYLLFLIYLFPIYVHFNLRFQAYLQWPLVMAISHPILSLALFLAVGILNVLLFLVSPLLVMLLSPSLTACIITSLVSKAFPIYERKLVN